METIIQYCMEELKMPQVKAVKLTEAFKNHPDILEEFKTWISERTFDVQTPIEVEGYTAKKIKESAPFLEGIGVYKFLITLRERPEKAKEYISKGFPRK